MSILQNIKQKLYSHSISKWFHTRHDDNITPALSVQHVNDLFIEFCNKNGFVLSISEKEFRKCICEFTCVYYRATKESTFWAGPHRTHVYPQYWSEEIEDLWVNHVDRVFSYTMWEFFWNQIPTALWEETLPEWRMNVQHVYTQYLQRSMDILVAQNVLVETNDGHIMTTDMYDDTIDTGYPY